AKSVELAVEHALLGPVAAAAMGIPVVGWAMAATEAIKTFVYEPVLEVTRDKARQLLGCTCIRLVEGLVDARGPDELCRVWVSKFYGTAFIFERVALCHPEDDFDVKQLTTWVYRPRRGGGFIKGNGDTHIRACARCRGKA